MIAGALESSGVKPHSPKCGRCRYELKSAAQNSSLDSGRVIADQHSDDGGYYGRREKALPATFTT